MTYYDVAFEFPMSAGSSFPQNLDTIFQDYEAIKAQYDNKNSMTEEQAQVVAKKLKELHINNRMSFDVIVRKYRID